MQHAVRNGAGAHGEPVGDMVADFRLVRRLGETGAVVLAEPPQRLNLSARHVVLRVLPAGAGPDGSGPLQSILGALQIFVSAGVDELVELYEAGQDSGTFYYAMEYLPRGSLARPSEPLTVGDAVRAIAHAARGAHALHERGLAHRNIRPAGILLTDTGAKLSDLGLASYLQPGMTITGRAGLPDVEYVDPMIIRGGHASRATDVWSLGAALHRVVSGQPIYPGLDGRNPMQSLTTVLTRAPVLDPALPGPVAEVVRACLEPDPARRPATALEVADRLIALGAPS